MAEEQSLDDCCQPKVGADQPVLILGRPPSEFKALWPEADTETPSSSLEQRYQLAVLIDPASLAVGVTSAQLLAAARDRWAKQVLALIPSHSNDLATEREYFAMGFSHRPLPKALQTTHTAYGFSISRYKPTPDWLNSRFWANPERWKKN